MSSKEKDHLVVNRTQQKFAKAHQRVSSTLLSLSAHKNVDYEALPFLSEAFASQIEGVD